MTVDLALSAVGIRRGNPACVVACGDEVLADDLGAGAVELHQLRGGSPDQGTDVLVGGYAYAWWCYEPGAT
jgi:hypothetical protein